MTTTTDPTVRVQRSPKRVRAFLGGEPVADSRDVALVWEHDYYPTYYFPAADVTATLTPTGGTEKISHLGRAEILDVAAGAATAAGAARRFGSDVDERLRGLVRLDWAAMQEWLEEDEPVYVHARNPYTRVDILGSSRHIEVVLDGITVADSRQPRVLFETGLIPRYYLPMADVRYDLLRPTDRQTHCPYKGNASYFSVDTGTRAHRDVVWLYRTPLPESQKVAGLLCFYDERVEMWVDGVKQERPASPLR
jgi:uncharacterized protein (DUF427 family)